MMLDTAVARARLAANVDYCLKQRDISMSDLAESVGCTVTTILRVRRADNDPAFTLVARIADYFKVSTDDLMQSMPDFKRIYRARNS